MVTSPIAMDSRKGLSADLGDNIEFNGKSQEENCWLRNAQNAEPTTGMTLFTAQVAESK